MRGMAESTHKAVLLEAATALREVHRALVQAVRSTYEQEVGPAGGPGQMLRLLTEDPYFAWLHPMSELIVDLDSLLAQELLPKGTVSAVGLGQGLVRHFFLIAPRRTRSLRGLRVLSGPS